MRIGIIESSDKTRDIIIRALRSVPDYSVIWVTDNGLEGIKNADEDKPDLVIIELMLENHHTPDIVRELVQKTSCAVLVTTDSIEKNTTRVFESMGAGALDVVNLPVEAGKEDLEKAILQKVRTVNRLIFSSSKKDTGVKKYASENQTLIAIGCSTGGPAALATLLAGMPNDIKAAIVVIQHLNDEFTSGFADWLNTHTGLPVRLAREGDRPLPGTVLVGASSDHLVLSSEGNLHYTDEPKDYVYRPSVNEFFNSVAKNWHGNAVGVLLTGMGKDGATGLLAMKERFHTIAEAQETCAVYGMPKAAAEINAATEVLPLYEISKAVMKKIQE